MGVDEGSIATTALIIAMAAFVIACGQLLQQLFATADGLRRCQNSVIGGWSQLVQLRFRWSSFRFEVRVVTPHFEIATDSQRSFDRIIQTTSVRNWDRPPSRWQKLVWKHSSLWCRASKPVAMVGTQQSRTWTSLQTIQTASTEEPVTWLSLIEDIHAIQGTPYRLSSERFRRRDEIDYAALLCFTRHTRSWDFMPVEIVRPFASTTIGCLISIVHRMGLTWIDFRPDEGVIRATGNGRSISASRIRGLGLVVEYIHNGTSLPHDSRGKIESHDADKMACGILPGYIGTRFLQDLPLRDQTKSVEVQLSRAFRLLSLDDVTVKTLQDSLAYKTTKQALPSFADLLGLWTYWMPLSTEGKSTVENPFPIEVEPMGKRPESRVIWKFLTQQHLPQSPHTKRVVEIYDKWESFDSTRFYTICEVLYYRDAIDPADSAYILTTRAFFKDVFFETDSYFNRYDHELYLRLVRTHVAINAQSFKQAEENIRIGLVRPHPQIPRSSSPYQGDSIFTERAFVYVDNIPKVVRAMESFTWAGSSPIPPFEEAWWMMMIRMQVWNMSVKLVMREGLTVPHYYYEDPSRVYIL